MVKIKKEFIIVLAVFVLGAFLRFYNLSNNPPGLYVDEASIGYNALSILETGRGEYGKAFPVYFRSFGDYKMPLYIYLSVIPIKLFGLNPFSIRFCSAFFGSLSIILIYFLVKKLFSQKSSFLPLSIVSSVIFAISPWSIFNSRAAFEVETALFFCYWQFFFKQ